MVVEALLSIVMNLVEFFVSLVPDFGLDLGDIDVAGAVDAIGNGAAGLNGYVPFTVAIGVAVMLLILQIAMSGWGFIVWLYHQFWGSD